MLNFAGNGAVLSECGIFRWRLDRHVGGSGPVTAVFGINPSTADHENNDATVRKWIGFGQCLGWRRFIVGNVFGFRATDVRALAAVSDPFGAGNSHHLREIIAEADLLIPCWGNRAKLPKPLRPILTASWRFSGPAENLCNAGGEQPPVIRAIRSLWGIKRL